MKQLAILAAAGLATALGAPALAQDKIDFKTQIEPILAETCYQCHGEKDKGGLVLNTKDRFLKGGDLAQEEGVATLTAGDVGKSNLYYVISVPHDDPDIMPPKGDPLKKEQIDLIKKWIEQGADFGDWTHSAIQSKKPTGPVLPQVPEAPKPAMDRLGQAGALAMPLARDTNLVNVDFRAVAPEIGDSHLELLAPMAEQVAWLGLARTKITDTGLKHLEPLKNLRRLHLENTTIGDEGVKHLSKLIELRYLNLYGTKITDAGLAHLKPLTNLESLYLWQTGATEQGVADLQKALPNTRIDTGYKAPAPEKPAEGEAAAADAKPINAKCPVSGKPIDAAQFVIFQDQKVAFCCGNCKGKFEADAKPFIEKIENFKPKGDKPAAAADAAPINAKCPVSGKPVDAGQFVVFQDQKVAFCCGNCKGKFEADAKPFIAKIENFKPKN